jgi:replicative DNA helicase
VPESRWPKILEACQRLAQAPMFVDDSSDTGVLEVRAKARRLHNQMPNGLELIIIDYLQLMRHQGRVESRVEQVGQISRGLKGLARELNVPVIALSQLSRAVEQRGGDKKPILSDLRESGAIERRPRHVHLSRGVLRQGVRAARRGGHHHRQAPQWPGRRGHPNLPKGGSAVHELRRGALRPMSTCALGICDGSGFIYDDATNTAYDCRCRPQIIALAKARSLSAVIPRRYSDVSFDRPPATDIDPQIVAATRRMDLKLA